MIRKGLFICNTMGKCYKKVPPMAMLVHGSNGNCKPYLELYTSETTRIHVSTNPNLKYHVNLFQPYLHKYK